MAVGSSLSPAFRDALAIINRARFVAESGTDILCLPEIKCLEDQFPRAAFEAKYADEAKYGKVNVVNFGPTSGPLGAPGSADMVITARNLHNWATQPAFLEKVLKDVHAVLKPGGILAVEEHRADPRPQDADLRSGYMNEAAVIAAAEKAGFKLAAKSEINANPKDTKDHPFGVWTLPPVRRTSPFGQPDDPKFDRAKYDAIGESDRMTLKFVKP